MEIKQTSQGVTYTLDFLLIVETANHEIIKQTPDDRSKLDPMRPFFADVQDKKLLKASLVGKGHMFTVDLVRGFIEVDGRKLHPPVEIMPGSKFKLIYYRNVQQRIKATYETQPVGLLAKMGLVHKESKVLEPVVRYYIGWQIEGTNKKWEMGVD